MANWTRLSLANLVAGYDAVIEFSEGLVGQILAKQTVSIPAVKSQPHSYNAKEIKGLPASAFPSATLTLQSSGGLDIEIISKTGLVSSTGVLLKLLIKNNTNSQLVLVAVMAISGSTRPPSPGLLVMPMATGTLQLNLPNTPAGTHPVTLRLFDLNGSVQDTNVQGDLTVSNWNLTGYSKLALLPGFITRSASTVTVKATTGSPLLPDLTASSPGNILLKVPVTFDLEVSESTSYSIQKPFAVFNLETGRPIFEFPLDTTYLVSNRQVHGQLELSVPLKTVIDPITKTIDVEGDLTQATVSLITSDTSVQAAQQDLEQLMQQAVQNLGIRLSLTPRISLVGSIQSGQPVPEINIQSVQTEALGPIGINIHACLAVAVALVGNTNARSSLSNFTSSDDYAVLIAGRVMQAIAEFRWGLGHYPSVLPGSIPDEKSYKENGGPDIPVLIYLQVRQKGIVDDQGNTLALIRLAGQQTYGTDTGILTFLMTSISATLKNHQEDHILLGGRGDFEISNVVKKADGSPVTQEVKDSFTVPANLQNVMFHWPFVLGNVGTPGTAPDINAEQFIQAMRNGVTQHLSRPFASVYTIQLTGRYANGNENLLLSRGSISL